MTESVTADIPITAAEKPRHVAIIMDGNNRWAKKKSLLGVSGHKAGVDAVRAVVETCVEEGIGTLTLFAFSSENWRRPAEEVSALMKLFLLALQREVKKLHKNNIRLRIIGDRRKFSPLLQEHMERAETLTAKNTRLNLVIAANYGGHWDITQATQKIAGMVETGEIKASDVNDDLIQQHLCLGELPMPDLCIRTAGEQRISNFMLWQFAYTELYFSDVYWPDFKHEEMRKALVAYSARQRRFGQTDDQIKKS
ncbi:polyprenyl diphosphate synthase [Alkalimarinus alittae]|uniref:Ditrans,polycis-undecaprenyl-diphosphate synthase ((2E,6E)-farnesyl-diphosphate specific) n=1 Tax=Alkalimarinus alittae TaxID=2961619 RepID=A0ABY6MZ15_9ALTE|nr:polyprenyl diphosphate synthase [Alkalimarinus alittae]UZE95086.1 polyprenyl diphosphate synthase [Alkalimarinus alittae]